MPQDLQNLSETNINFTHVSPQSANVNSGDTIRTPEVIEREFDSFAAQYEEALNEGLSVSGEGPEYFAKKRIEWTNEILSSKRIAVDKVLDFGCGVGIATDLLRSTFAPWEIHGFDPSSAAIARAKNEFAAEDCHFTHVAAELPRDHFDLAYCNGVFHHIEPEHRKQAFSIVFDVLKPGGWFAFWENNPWNPGTRYVMSKIPFDRDAIVISPREARFLLKSANFEVHRTDAWFLFPRMLRWLRPLERLVYWMPLGAQYLVLAKKPGESRNPEA